MVVADIQLSVWIHLTSILRGGVGRQRRVPRESSTAVHDSFQAIGSCGVQSLTCVPELSISKGLLLREKYDTHLPGSLRSQGRRGGQGCERSSCGDLLEVFLQAHVQSRRRRGRRTHERRRRRGRYDEAAYGREEYREERKELHGL